MLDSPHSIFHERTCQIRGKRSEENFVESSKTRFTLEEIVPPGFVMNPERFSTGLVLPFTQKWTNPT